MCRRTRQFWSLLQRPAHVLTLFALILAGTLHAEDAAPRGKVLVFSKSSGFQHPIINRYGKELSEGEKILSEIITGLGMEAVCTKDGSLITADYLEQFSAVVFYTSGDLFTLAPPDKKGTEDTFPVVTPEGKTALLEAIRNGLGFVGIHSASDCWHTVDPRYPGKAARYVPMGGKLDPYLAMLGGEFIAHDKHQAGTFIIVDGKFPGMTYAGPRVTQEMNEWYSLKDFAPDMHVLMVMETEGLEGPHYERGPYPLSWIRNHGKGRVFYTALGHGRSDWDDPNFRSLLGGGIQWATGRREADISPNLVETAPRHAELPQPPSKRKTPPPKTSDPKPAQTTRDGTGT